MQTWTDYPIVELGDEPGAEAPVRPCRVLDAYHHATKYTLITVEGVQTEIKKGYVYTEPGRCGEATCAFEHGRLVGAER